MTSTRPRVSILQRRLVNYRIGLFERLRDACDHRSIELRVVYGQASPSDAMRQDAGSLDWADEVDARWFSIGGTEVVWQPCPRPARRSDLVILTQESKILSNYPFLAARGIADRKVAYWGHGRNLQSANADGARERWKAMLSTRVDWWFAYTAHTGEILTAAGFDPGRITVLDNAIDNEAFQRDLDAVTDEMLVERRRQIDLPPDGLLGFYCGALYDDKRVDLLVDVARRIHEAEPGFRLVVIGDGPSRPQLEELMAPHPWAHWLGARSGLDKAAWFRLADAILSPGAVGLHVLDAFASSLPLFTTAGAKHGPEIDYLDHGRNGFVLSDDPTEFASEVVDVLRDTERRNGVIDAGRRDADRYTLDNMVENFVGGMVACLGIDG